MYNLTTHHRTHVICFLTYYHFQKGYRPYKCPSCSKTFMENSFLITHIRSHTGKQPFNCKNCKKGFKSKKELSNHEESIHGDIKKYRCTKCPAKYSNYNSLKVHQKVHSGKKPYKCPFPECNKAFIEKGNMKSHFKVHVLT